MTFVPELNVIIEIDGRPAFAGMNWKAPELQQERDHYKMKLAQDNGYTVIRFYQPDIFFGRNDWETKTKETIKNTKHLEIIFISDGTYLKKCIYYSIKCLL